MKIMIETTGPREVADLLRYARIYAAEVSFYNDGLFNQGYALGRLLMARFHMSWPDSDMRDIACISAENEIGFLFRRARERAREEVQQ